MAIKKNIAAVIIVAATFISGVPAEVGDVFFVGSTIDSDDAFQLLLAEKAREATADEIALANGDDGKGDDAPLESLGIKHLKALAKEKGIEFDNKTTKDELIAALKKVAGE